MLKKIKTALLIGTVVGGIAYADTCWILNGSNIYNANTGNIAIGHTNPSEKLHIAGGNIYTDSENFGLIVDSYGYKRIGFMKYAGTEGSLVHGNTVPLRLGRVNQASITGGTYTEEMRIETNGNVGIGTTNAAYPLTVKSVVHNYMLMATDGSIYTGMGTGVYSSQVGGYLGTQTTHPLFFCTGNSVRMLLDTSGNLGIGVTSAGAKLDVNGSIVSRSGGLTVTNNVDSTLAILPIGSGQVRIKTDVSGRWMSFADGAGTTDVMAVRSGTVCIGTTTARSGRILNVNGSGYFTGIVTTGSSRSLKKDIVPLTKEEALTALKVLEPVKYRYRADDVDEKLGFIAEDVPVLLAELDRKSLNPMDFAALAISVIQDQQSRIEKLEKELAALKDRISANK